MQAANSPTMGRAHSCNTSLRPSQTGSSSMPNCKPSTLLRTLCVGVFSNCLGLFTTAAWAALKPGDAAPDFTVDAALGGKEFTFSLTEALKKGPVVLYFY